jgi:hypothetical protein
MSSFPCKIIEADLDADIVTLQMEGDYTVSAGQKYLCDAAAASAEPVAAPKGWRLVPVSPTKEMLLAGETDEYDTAIWWDLMLAAAPAAPVTVQPDLTQQTLDDVKAGIPARDAEIEALQKENLALLHRAAIDAEVASRLARRLFEISAVISPDTPIAQHDISDLLARVKRVVSTLAQQVDKSPETQEKTVDKSPDLQGHASVIFAKAVAWADARVDAALTQPEQEGYESACDDADQAHYELVQALRNLREAQQPVSGADGLPKLTDSMFDAAAGYVDAHGICIEPEQLEGILSAALAQQDASKVDAALAEMVHAMFRSANSIPVTRITINRKQYEAAIDAARKEPA